jgi:glycosyltransferase involved in cell wall biosynthesis
MKETHRFLREGLANHGVSLVPLVTRPEQVNRVAPVGRYALDDALSGMKPIMPEDADCVLLLDPVAPIDYGRLVRLRREKGLVVLAMVNDLLPIHYPHWFPPKAGGHYKILLQQIMRTADHLVVPSQEVSDGICRLGWRIQPPVHVAHLGTAFHQMPPALQAQQRVKVLYVSTIEPRKGHSILIAAFDLLRTMGVDVELTIVGRIGWESDDLVAMIRTHPCFGDALRWIRHGDDDTVRGLMASGPIAAMPTEGEGFGIFLEEALSAGLSVVATDLPVLRERPYPNVAFVEGTAKGFADGIRAAAENRPVELGPNTIRSMKAFSSDVQDLILSLPFSHRN